MRWWCTVPGNITMSDDPDNMQESNEDFFYGFWIGVLVCELIYIWVKF